MRIEHTLRPICCAIAQSVFWSLAQAERAAPSSWGCRISTRRCASGAIADGLEVVMMDADTVSETNCVRQPFSTSDIGQNKATVLINRINLFWGTNWSAIPNHFHARSFDRNQDRCPDLVIGCVDTRAARKAIEDSFSRALSRTCYWLDLGNNAASGQYVLGQPLNARNRRKADRLRTVERTLPGDRRRRSRRRPVAQLFGGRSSGSAGAVHQPDACCECAGHAGATLPVRQAHPSRRLLQCEDRTDVRLAGRSGAVVEGKKTAKRTTARTSLSVLCVTTVW